LLIKEKKVINKFTLLFDSA